MEKNSPPYGNTFCYNPKKTANEELDADQIDFWENKLDTVMIQINGKNLIFRRTAY